MDILDELIAFAQISGSVNVKCQFQGDWALNHATQRGQGVVHIVTGGSAYLSAGADTRTIQSGDVIFFPRGLGHQLRSSAEQAVNFAENLTAYGQGAFSIKQNFSADSADFTMFCATFEYEPQAELIKNLPEMLCLSLPPTQLDAVVMLLQAEVAAGGLGGKQVVDALALVLLALIVRRYLADSPKTDAPCGTLRGWQDKRLQPLLAAVVQAPEKTWSLDEMATFAHLSRSKLIRLFQQTLATSPHAFLHRIRLQKAAMLLKQSADSVLTIALATGFQSETHFGKAFKKRYGLTPGQYRVGDCEK